MVTVRYKYRWGRYVLAGAVLGVAALGVIRLHSTFTAPVVYVVDGDTFRVSTDEGIKTVRVWGIDAPEIRQTFGNEAAAWAAYRLLGAEVGLHVKDVDRWDRLVCKVELPDGEDFGEAAVGEGIAWWYGRYAAKETRLRDLMMEARECDCGLWLEEDPVPPWEWRHGRR